MLDIGTLVGRTVSLVPMGPEHVEALIEVGIDPALWEWSQSAITTPDAMRNYVEDAFRERDMGTAYPFVTVLNGANKVIGSTRFANIVPAHKRLEIGWTWIAAPWQRTVVNTEAKYLMLRYAFENLKYNRVELKTDALNTRSRKAMERIGATFEGTLRKHMVCESGRIRDTVYYSITDTEWPIVKTALQNRLEAGV